MFAWAGPPRDDGSRPMLAVLVVTPPPGERTDYGIWYIIEKVRPPADQCPDWKQAPAESGVLGGFPTMRAGCQGTMSGPAGKASIRWSLYLCQTEARTFVFLFAIKGKSDERLRSTFLSLLKKCVRAPQ